MKQELTRPVSHDAIEIDEKLSILTRAVAEKKALNIVALDLRDVASFADYLLICSGTSTRQVQAIADAVQRRLKEAGTRPLHIEGQTVAQWILIDYGDVIVHVFEEHTREFYDLERLWRDARPVPLPDEIKG